MFLGTMQEFIIFRTACHAGQHRHPTDGALLAVEIRLVGHLGKQKGKSDFLIQLSSEHAATPLPSYDRGFG